MLHSNRPSEQGSLQHKTASPTYWGDDFVCNSFIAPNEYPSFSNHSSEEVLIARPMELRAEGRLPILENLPSQQNIPCPSLVQSITKPVG